MDRRFEVFCVFGILGGRGSRGFYFYSSIYNCKSGIIYHELCIDSNPSLFSEIVKCKSCLKHNVHRNINIFSVFVSKYVSVLKCGKETHINGMFH